MRVCACVWFFLLSSLQSEDEQWWASAGKWLSERGHRKKSNKLPFFRASKWLRRGWISHLPTFNPHSVVPRSYGLKTKLKIAVFFTFFSNLSCSTPSALRTVWAIKHMNFIMVPGMGPVWHQDVCKYRMNDTAMETCGAELFSSELFKLSEIITKHLTSLNSHFSLSFCAKHWF